MRESAHTLASELSEAELSHLCGLIRQGKLTGKHLEIGTAAGGTLVEMMKCFNESLRPQFVVIDPMTYFPDQIQTIHSNLKKYGLNPNQIDIRVQKSIDAFHMAEKQQETFDFILIDAGHKIKYVTQDLHWARRLNNGGLLCLHDYHSGEKGVLLAANRFMRRHRNFHKESVVERLLVLRKTSGRPTPEVSFSDTLYALMLSPILQLERGIKKRLS